MYSVLHEAEAGGISIENFKTLCDFQSNKNPKSKGRRTSVMHVAAENGRDDILMYLFNIVEEKNLLDRGMFSILHTAAVGGIEIDKFKTLCDSQMDKNPMDQFGTSVMHFAAENGRNDILINLFDKVEEKIPVDKYGCSHCSVMPTAALGSNLESFKVIYEHQAEENPKAKDRRSVVHFAAQNKKPDIFKYLYNIIEEKNPLDDYWNTLMQSAVSGENFDIIKFLCQHINEKNPQNEDGTSVLHLAVIYGRYDILKFIGDQVEEKNPVDNVSVTILH